MVMAMVTVSVHRERARRGDGTAREENIGGRGGAEREMGKVDWIAT